MLKNNHKESLVVFPTSRAIREHLSFLKNTNQLLNKNITIGDFFSRVTLNKQNYKTCDKNLRILYLKEAIANIDIKKLGFSGDFSTFLKQSDYIFRFFNECASEYISFDKLLEYDTYTLYSDHIDILKAIYINYSKILEQNSLADIIFLPDNYILNKDYLDQFESISIYLEGYLSRFEFNIIKDISKNIDTIIHITFNEYNKKNMQLFENIKDQLKVGYIYKINLSNEEILEQKEQKKQVQNVCISPIASELEQIAFIKYQISRMVQSGIEPEKIAVILPNEQFISELELFDNEHYFNFAMGRSISNTKISKVVKLINKILLDFEPKDLHKFNFFGIKEEDFTKIFRDNWNNTISKEIFENVLNYLFSFEKDENILEKLLQLKISLDTLLFTNIQTNHLKIKLKEFIKLFLNQLSSITIDDVNGGKVTVLGVLETRAIQYDGIIVCDFNDDKVPKLSVKDKFISSHIKQLANLPTINDRENLQRYYYKRIFDKAKDIAICYIDNESYNMSRFIVQLFSEYKKYLKKDNFSSILFNKKQLMQKENEIILDIDLSKQIWSATSFKEFLTCKRRYYFNYIAKIKQHHFSIKPPNYEIGNIIHNTLQEAVKKDSLDSTFLNSYLSGFQKENPYLVLELELWKKRLQGFIKLEESRAKNGIKIISVEEPFNIKYKDINIKGKIDRIDKLSDNSFEILDYKTSSSVKIDTIKNYEDSKDFQLEFYYLACRDKNIKSVGYYELSSSTIKTQNILDEKLKLLDNHFEKLKTKSVNFGLSESFSDCQFCTYKIICGRD